MPLGKPSADPKGQIPEETHKQVHALQLQQQLLLLLQLQQQQWHQLQQQQQQWHQLQQQQQSKEQQQNL